MYKLYSQRQNTNQTCHPLEYDKIPQEFIQQYLYIARDLFNASPKPAYGQHRYWECLAKKYCREKGIELLGEDTGEYALEIELFLKHPDTTTEDILALVEKYNNGWIPCSERLPERGQTVLWSINTEKLLDAPYPVILGTVGVESTSERRWKTWANAWQPLPAPYKGEQK